MRLAGIIGGVIAVAAISIATWVAWAAPEPERPRCENCGMFTDVSSTHVLATLKVDGKAAEHNFVCLGCIQEFNEANYDGQAKLTSLRVTDYNTSGAKSVKLIDGTKAYYLYDTIELAGSMAPFIPAFATKDDALKAQQTLGGELLNFKDMWAQLSSGAEKANTGDAANAKYACTMCNYETDQPGKCPHCGMTLTKVSAGTGGSSSGGKHGCGGGCCG